MTKAEALADLLALADELTAKGEGDAAMDLRSLRRFHNKIRDDITKKIRDACDPAQMKRLIAACRARDKPDDRLR